MAFDQDITYRVNIDDSNFQSKLTQLRSSLDSSLSGGGGGMGSGLTSAYAMAQLGGGGGGSTMSMGGMADFGSMIRPVTYTPPAIAMQPHFGMVQIQQTLGQAGLGAMGPLGNALYSAGGAIGGFMRGGLSGAANAPGMIPQNTTAYEYYNASAQAFGNRVGDAASMGGLTAMNMAASIPFVAAGSALGSAAFGGAGFAAGAAGLLGGAAASMIPAAFMASVGDAYRENVATQEALQAGSFRFISGTSPDVDQARGRGFSRAAREKVAHGIQAMELNDTRYGAQEYRQVLESGMQNDLFSGTRNTQEFQEKLKGIVESVKTITSTLHTSLKEGVEVVRGFRDIGVTDSSQINRMVLGSEVMGRASGRTGMEMMAIGQTGAEMFRGTGISMARGFELNQMNAMNIRQGLDHGTLSREAVMQAGGETAFAQQMTANTLSSFQSTIGRGMLMGAFNPQTGTLDMQRMMKPQDAQSIAMGATGLGAQGMLALEARQEDLISQMSPMQMRMFAVNQSVGMATTLKNSGYARTMEDAMFHAGRMQGHSTSQIKADIAFAKQDPETYKRDQQAAIDSVATQAGLEDTRNRFNVGKKISNWFRGTFVEPVSEALLGVRGSVAGAVESAEQSLVGRSVVSAGLVSAEVRKLASKGASGDTGFTDISDSPVSDSWRNLVGGVTGKGALDSFAGQSATSTKYQAPGSSGPGTDLEVVKNAGGGQAFAFKTKEEAMAFQKQSHQGGIGLGMQKVNVGGKMVDRFLFMRNQDVEAETKARIDLQVTDADRKKVEAETVDDKVLDNISMQGERLRKEGKSLSLEDISQRLYGKAYKDLTGEQRAVEEKYLKAGGIHTEKALKEVATITDTQQVRDAASKGRERNADEAKEARRIITAAVAGDHSNMGGDSTSRGHTSKLLGNLTEAEFIKLGEAAGGSEEAKASAIRELAKSQGGETKARQLVGAFAGLSAENQKKVKEQFEGLKTNINAITSIDKASGAVGSGGSGPQELGNISKETSEVMKKMSADLLTSHEMLMKYHKMFQAEIDKNARK